MKTINKITKSFIFILLLTLFAAPALQAQTGFDNTVDDQNQQQDPVPIDTTIWVGFIGAAVIAYTLTRNKQLSR